MNWITLVETATFIKRAEKILTIEELDNIKDVLSENPEAGVLIKIPVV